LLDALQRGSGIPAAEGYNGLSLAKMMTDFEINSLRTGL
jgi:hypothetical protein